MTTQPPERRGSAHNMKGASPPSQRQPSEVDARIGGRLRLIRQARGMSLEALANAAGLSAQQLHKYELGYNRLSVTRLKQLTELLGISIFAFLAAVGSEPPTDLAARRRTALLSRLCKAAASMNASDLRQLVSFAEAGAASRQEPSTPPTDQ